MLNYNKYQMKQAIQSYKKFGYGLVPDFLSQSVCQKAIKQINRLIIGYEPSKQHLSIFQSASTVKSKKQNDYFLKSGDKVRFFFEQGAYDLKEKKLQVQKINSINKIGHALHQHNKLFQMITFEKDIKQICRNLAIMNPVVVQSMAILKPPKVGGKVSIHQDSTFLYDDPLTLVGFWIPLQDATINNGCLWGLPGSHLGKLYKRAKMNWKQSVMEFHQQQKIDYSQNDFIPLQMKKGTLAFFHGKFLHKSQANTSNISRYAYTWHLKQGNTKWASENWLQRQKFPNFKFEYQNLL